MIFIWGLRVRGRVLGTGTFACPNCGGDRHYEHKQARRWFTAFFIPIIPLKVIGEYILCTTCKTSYNPAVLSLPTADTIQKDLVFAMREAVVLVLGKAPTSAEMHEAVLMLSSFANSEWHEDDLIDDLAHMNPDNLPGRLANLAQVLNEHGKERIVAGLARVASTGGTMDDDHRKLVMRVASDIGMTPAHARGVIDDAIEQQHA